MATESARSALRRLHHQLEYEPPGELHTTSSETAAGKDGRKTEMEENARNGRSTNWHTRPHAMPRGRLR